MVAGRLGWRQWHQCECEQSHCLGRLETSPLPAPHNKTACVVCEQGCSPGRDFRPHVTINDQNSQCRLWTRKPILVLCPFPFSTVLFSFLINSYCYQCIPTPILCSTRTWKSQWTLCGLWSTLVTPLMEIPTKVKRSRTRPLPIPHTEVGLSEGFL